MALARLAVVSAFVALFALFFYESIHHKHFHATHLLDDVDVHVAETPEEREQISALYDEIHEQRNKMKALQEEMVAIMTDQRHALGKGGWESAASTLQQITKMQMKLNEKEREMQQVQEVIDLHFMELKPYHGVYSGMFAKDAAMSLGHLIIPYIQAFSMHVLIPITHPFLTVFLCIFFPALLFAVSMFMYGLAFSILPFASMIWAALCAFRFPVLVLQYNPTPAEFFISYFLYLSLLIVFVRLCWAASRTALGRP
eukprot:TRINITY_DN3066_c0_g1_i1.p1 TRINITY_DN3066_c0_g1~~TRINITY_DN3066_c0_g1_i1.p1  ORF type:complete len:270 (-),score=93.60 TRINITY_DN3066_c0_g1_i1:132-899(-)